jgi:AraC-like DNA-binding protein
VSETTTELPRQTGGQNPFPSFRFETSDRDAPFEAWRSVLDILFDSAPARHAPPASFRADLAVHHFGSFLLCRSVADGGRYRRNDLRLARDDLDHIVVSCVVRGRVGLSVPRLSRLSPGDVAVFDLSTPVAFVMRSAEAVHLIVPRALLPASVAPAQPVSGRILSRGTAIGVFACGAIQALAEAAMRFGANELAALGSIIPDLIASCLGPADATAPTARSGDLGRRLRRHIEDNLHQRDLTTARLTRELGVSRSQLFRQFETTGGVETYIRRRRLRRSLFALCDPRHADRRIGDIAFDMGFADEAHFSRLFRQAFGLSPRAARDQARGKGDATAGGIFLPATVDTAFSDWVMELRAG